MMNEQQLIYRLTRELYDLKCKLDKIRFLTEGIYNRMEKISDSSINISVIDILNLIDVTEDYSEIDYDNN